MEQYKVILVDDEVEVIDAMQALIHWAELGFEVVGSATNGVKALELVEKLQPDVVLTDIKMPYMDGLELARRLNKDYPNIYILLCTGFDEFEYAQEAVRLEIKEYMLKPINASELSAGLTKLKDTLDREREEKLNVRKLACIAFKFIRVINRRSDQRTGISEISFGIPSGNAGSAVLLCHFPHIQHSCAGWGRSCAFVNVS